MKKIVIAAGVAGLIYYFFFYNKTTAASGLPSTAATAGSGTLNNPAVAAGVGNSIHLGPSFAQRVPGVASVS